MLQRLRANAKPIAAAIVLVLVLAAGSQLTVEHAEATVAWIRGAGPLGAVAYSFIYVLGTLAALPASWLQGGAGFLWGPLYGPLFAWLASAGFGTLNFWLGRTLLRDWVEARAASNPRFQAVDAVIGEDGLLLVILLRLSPMAPYNVVSYGLGLTRIKTRHYIVGTLVGSVPAVAIWSTIGASLEAIAGLLDGSATAEAGGPWLAALALTAFATIAVTLYARKALNEALIVKPLEA